jgi:SAM-dependent methyltransferase
MRVLDGSRCGKLLLKQMRNLWRSLKFNLWYFRQPPWDTGISPPELLRFIQSHPPGRALDLGCGTGTNVITLVNNGWEVTGVDFSRKAIQVARKKAAAANVQATFHVRDVSRLPDLTPPFDLILDIGCYHGLSSPGKRAYRHNIRRLLGYGGTYLMYGFFKDPSERGPGLLEGDIAALHECLEFVSREDGTERNMRPSAWFTFRNP